MPPSLSDYVSFTKHRRCDVSNSPPVHLDHQYFTFKASCDILQRRATTATYIHSGLDELAQISQNALQQLCYRPMSGYNSHATFRSYEDSASSYVSAMSHIKTIPDTPCPKSYHQVAKPCSSTTITSYSVHVIRFDLPAISLNCTPPALDQHIRIPHLYTFSTTSSASSPFRVPRYPNYAVPHHSKMLWIAAD